jgi:type IV fimbrial biogenesis protein FimT
MHQRGFSALELLVALSVCGILSLIGAPSISRMMGQLRSAEEARRCALTLIAARDEAVRLRADVTVSLTSTGLTVDLYGDDTIEHTLLFYSGSTWESSLETTITFNGLGLARGLSGVTTLAISNGGARSALTVNQNGTVTL